MPTFQGHRTCLGDGEGMKQGVAEGPHRELQLLQEGAPDTPCPEGGAGTHVSNRSAGKVDPENGTFNSCTV